MSDSSREEQKNKKPKKRPEPGERRPGPRKQPAPGRVQPKPSAASPKAAPPDKETGPSFTPQEVLQGTVDPHAPETRIEAKTRTKKELAQPGELGTFTAHEVIRGTIDPHQPEKSPGDLARERGYANSPSIRDFVDGQSVEAGGASFAQMLPGSRPKAAENLPEPEMRPPPFLSPFEAMKDVYFKVKGRASNKTQELLEGADLEDLVETCVKLIENEELSRKTEARLLGPIHKQLVDEPGPLLLGLNDPRLCEPWRLFLDGWDIWVPEGDGGGVELFWEGEAEDEAGEPIEISWSLSFRDGELELEAKMGPHSDTVTFDGESFFRLKTRAGG